MGFRQTEFRPLIRGIAAGTLFVWLGALALCQTECCSGDEHHSDSAENHHAEVAAHDQDHDQDHGSAPGNQKESSACLCLKSVLHTSSAVLVSKAALHPLYELTFTSTPSMDAGDLSVLLRFRQGKPAE